MRNLPLKWKVFAYLLGFCAILLLILWIFQTVLLDAFYKATKVMEIKSSAGILAANIDSDELASLVSAVSQNGTVSVEIISEDGGDIAASAESTNIFSRMMIWEKTRLADEAKARGGEYILYETLADTFHPGKDPGERPFGSQPAQSILFVRIVRSSSGVTGAVLIKAQISPVDATVTTLRYQLYLITAVMLLLSVIIALLIARRVSKPIVELSGSAKALATGNYNVSFNGKGFREIGELSETLNTAAAELSKVEGLRRELMANISHDLRTPLSLIYSYAEVMHDFPDEITPDKTQVIMDETRRLTSLVSDILELTKLESGSGEPDIEAYNLTRSIEETVCRLSELLRKDGYTFDFCREGDAYVAADEKKITQVTYNLLLNAIHYTGPDRTVKVRQTAADGTVRIAVTDTGDGIAPEDQEYIWDRYYKVDKKHKRTVTGSGLGLSIVKKVVALHGGECGVISEVGHGSTFWFSLKTIDPPAGDE
jgi:signal transduction histidine kinase